MVLRPAIPPRRSGAVVIETAFACMILFIVLFAIFEYGRCVMMLQIVTNAAREGARQAVISQNTVPPATATSNVTNTVNQFLANQPLTNVVTQVYWADTNGNNIGAWTDAPFGSNIVVQVDADLSILFPFLNFDSNFLNLHFSFLPNTGAAPNSIHLRGKAMMRSEAN
jgi:Flp pilus assembly protein TadG